MREGASRGSLTRRLIVGTFATAVVVVVIVTLLLGLALSVSDAQRMANRSSEVLGQTALTERLVVDLETGLRGFVITGDRGFLEPYETARRQAPVAAARLSRLSDGQAQRRRAAEVEEGIGSYLREFARPLLLVGPPARSSKRAVAATTEGRRRLEALRSTLGAYGEAERARLADRSAQVDRRARRAAIVSSLSLVALIAFVVLMAVFLNRTVLSPVRRMSEAVERIRGGDLAVRLNQGGPSEIARLGAVIDELAQSLAESRERLDERTAELRRMSDRNLLVLDNVFSQTPAGMVLLDRDLRYIRVNAAQARSTGHPVEAHLGRHVSEMVPKIAPKVMPYMQHVLDTGETIEIEVQGETAAEPGVEHTWAVTYYALREEGEVTGVGGVVIDVSARRQAERDREAALEAERTAREAAEAARSRAAFLADAGAILDQSLELEETSNNLARICVPRVGDWCSIDLAAPGGRVRNAAVAHPDPAMVELARELQARYPPDPKSASGAPAVIRSGRPELYSEIPDELLRLGARDAEHYEIVRDLGMTSVMVVPLTARGETFGAITFVAAGGGRHFGPDDLALAQDLAARAALSLDNARLYRERSHVARTLQASLLPEALPEIPGIRIAARYEPLGAATEVGGDFYDVFPTDDDRWVVVIGDVCGKGAEAAALTALARYTLRAVSPAAPVDALLRLNDAILRQRDDLRFITLIYAVLDLSEGRRRLTMASGGHPPPLLVHPSGPGEVIACAGTLIGVTEHPTLTESFVELGPGDTVAFYTDGVTESSHASPLGAEAILDAVAGRHTAEDVADGLQRLARSNGAHAARDDVAILTLQVA